MEGEACVRWLLAEPTTTTGCRDRRRTTRHLGVSTPAGGCRDNGSSASRAGVAPGGGVLSIRPRGYRPRPPLRPPPTLPPPPPPPPVHLIGVAYLLPDLVEELDALLDLLQGPVDLGCWLQKRTRVRGRMVKGRSAGGRGSGGGGGWAAVMALTLELPGARHGARLNFTIPPRARSRSAAACCRGPPRSTFARPPWGGALSAKHHRVRGGAALEWSKPARRGVRREMEQDRRRTLARVEAAAPTSPGRRRESAGGREIEQCCGGSGGRGQPVTGGVVAPRTVQASRARSREHSRGEHSRRRKTG